MLSLRARWMMLCVGFIVSGIVPVTAVASPVEATIDSADETLLLAQRRRRSKRRRKRRRRRAAKPSKPAQPQPKEVVKEPAKEPPKPAVQVPAKTSPKVIDPNKPKPLKLAAFDMTSAAKDVDAKMLRVLTEVMLTKVSTDGRFESVITGSDLRALIDLENQKEMLGCEDAGCLTQLGQAVDVPYLLTSEVGRVGQQTVVNLKIIDIADAQVLAREGGMVEDESKLPDLVKEAAGKALASFFAQVNPEAKATAQTELEKLPAVAVLDLEAVHGVKSTMAAVLSDILLSRLSDSRKFSSIIAGEDLRDMVSLEQQKEALGCDDESCMTAIGGALGVPLMAVPSIGRVGEQFVLNLKVIEVEEAKVRVRKNRMVSREVDLPTAVLGLTDDVLKALFGEEALLTAEQATNRFARKLMRGTSLAVGLASVGSWGFSMMDLGSAQAAYDDPQTGLSEQTRTDLMAAQERAYTLRLGALVGGAVTAALWVFSPNETAP